MSIRKLFSKLGSFLAPLPVIGGLFRPRPKIAVVRMAGVIADMKSRKQNISFQNTKDILESAFDLPHLEAVALVINSPGGSPAQSQLIGNFIRKLAAEKEKPVYAFVEDVAASGGYWLACAADEIYAQESSIVGSIGVISASFGFEDFIERYDIHRRVQTAGKDKAFMDPFSPLNPEDVERLNAIQKDLHKIFIGWVKDRRGKRLKGTAKTLFEGQFWTAGPAQEKGIIDGIADVYSFCEDKHGKNIKFVDFSPDRKWWSGLFGARASLPDDMLETLENYAHWARYGL